MILLHPMLQITPPMKGCKSVVGVGGEGIKSRGFFLLFVVVVVDSDGLFCFGSVVFDSRGGGDACVGGRGLVLGEWEGKNKNDDDRNRRRILPAPV